MEHEILHVLHLLHTLQLQSIIESSVWHSSSVASQNEQNVPPYLETDLYVLPWLMKVAFMDGDLNVIQNLHLRHWWKHQPEIENGEMD